MVESNNNGFGGVEALLVVCIVVVAIMALIVLVIGTYGAHIYDCESNDFVYEQHSVNEFDFYIVNNIENIDMFENKFKTDVKYYVLLDDGRVLLTGIKLDVSEKYNMKILKYKVSDDIPGFVIDAGKIYD